MINEFMEKFVMENELPKSLSEETSGSYRLPMDEETTIEVSDVPPGFRLHCLVASIPEKDRETLFVHVLHGNLLGQGTEGAVLGMTEEGNYLTLSYDFEYPVSYNEFKEIIEEFFNVVDFWREEARLHKAGKLSTS